jgi:polygalacturonase
MGGVGCGGTSANADTAVFNILDYGAVRDASASSTEAFRTAIAAAQRAGGGTVCVPAGHYSTGPIQMVSNLTLFFDAGAIVSFPATVLPLTPGRQQGIETAGTVAEGNVETILIPAGAAMKYSGLTVVR